MGIHYTSDNQTKQIDFITLRHNINVIFICIHYTNHFHITLCNNLCAFIRYHKITHSIFKFNVIYALNRVILYCIIRRCILSVIPNAIYILCGFKLFANAHITMDTKSNAIDMDYEQSLSVNDAYKHIISAPLCNNNHGTEPAKNGNNGKNENNNGQQTQRHNDGDDGNNSNSSSNASCPGGNGDNRRNGDKNDDDDHNNKKEPHDAGDEDDEEEEKVFKKKTSALSPNAVVFRDVAKSEFSGLKMKTIDETRPLTKESRSKSIDPLGPGKIKISHKLTDKIITNSVRERLYNNYDYMNKSLVFKSIKKIYNNDSVCIINYGFRQRETNEPLYCVALKDASNNKYEWNMMDGLYTEDTIHDQYNITHNILPQPIDSDAHFSDKIQRIKSDMMLSSNIIHNILHETKWCDIPIYTKRNFNERKTLSLSQTQFKQKIQQFTDLNITNIRLVPIIRMNNKAQYWMECVWIVRIYQHMNIGISLQYDKTQKRMKVMGIHLNKDYLCKSHQLIPPSHDCHCLDGFVSFYGDLIIGNIDLRKENVRLKKEIAELKQQNNTFNDFIAKVSNSSDADQYDNLVQEATNLLNTAVTPLANDDEKCADSDVNDAQVQTEQNKPQIVEKTKEKLQSTATLTQLQQAQLDTINGDMILPYSSPNSNRLIAVDSYVDVLNGYSIFTTPLYAPPPPQTLIASPASMLQTINPSINPSMLTSLLSMQSLPNLPQTTFSVQPSAISDISLNLSQTCRYKCFPEHSTNSIFIEKSLTRDYSSETNAVFKDAKMLYYYLRQTIAMQINDRFAMIYDDTLGIIHCDLYHKQSGKTLYAIIEHNPHKNNTNRKQFKWKIVSLSTFAEISSNYHHLNIQRHQLPLSSRNDESFQIQLKQGNDIIDEIIKCINEIKIVNKRQVKSKSRDSFKANEEIKVSEDDLRQYIEQSVYTAVHPIIPIVKIKDSYHWVEWIVICETDTHLNFGVSFRCRDGKVDATSIFLDGTEVERQHLLINATYSYDPKTFVSGIGKMVIIKKGRKQSDA